MVPLSERACTHKHAREGKVFLKEIHEMHRTSQSDTGTNASLAPEGNFVINTLKRAVADSPVHIPNFICFRNMKFDCYRMKHFEICIKCTKSS